MSNLKQLKDKEGNNMYPVTHTGAVFDSNGRSVQDQLQALTERIEYLESQISSGVIGAEFKSLLIQDCNDILGG